MTQEKKIYSILVAEDDADDRDMVVAAIKESPIKCDVKLVCDGAELLEYLKTTLILPDVLLLDINMPKVDGLQALKQMKSDDRLKHIPVYILSTSNSAEHKLIALELGACRYCLKTPRYKELVDIIREVCLECAA